MTQQDKTPVHAPHVVVRNNLVPAKVGADVLYILAHHDSASAAGEVRPAKIVALVQDGSAHGLVNLQVFTNGGFDQLPNVHHAKNVLHDEDTKKTGTWHWPPPRILVFEDQQTGAAPEELDELEHTPPFPAPAPTRKLDEHLTSNDPFPSDSSEKW